MSLKMIKGSLLMEATVGRRRQLINLADTSGFWAAAVYGASKNMK